MTHLILLLASQPAHATSFTDNDVPIDFDIEFTYTSPVSFTNDTNFEFDNVTPDNSTTLCLTSELCMTGDFTTADGGEGPFTATAVRDNCTASPPPGSPPDGLNYVSRTCDVYQTLDLVFEYVSACSGDYTGAEYSGQAYYAEVTEDQLYYCVSGACLSLGFVNQSYDVNAGLFSGDIGGTLCATTNIVGTFTELSGMMFYLAPPQPQFSFINITRTKVRPVPHTSGLQGNALRWFARP